jgi:CubicO group peptidase (beta-lactamase class C family)
MARVMLVGAEELLPAARRALAHRVAVGQAEGRAPSLTGAVVRGGRQLWCGARAMAEADEPGGDTQYRIGSLTKMFVAVLVMRLRDEGRLDLADPLDRHLDAGEAEGVTVAQLLAHTAGLAAEARGPWWERTPGDVRPALADIFGERPRPHPAGRRFHYSNPGYALLGALIGRLRGHSWSEALRQEVLEPLGMARTTLLPQPPYARGFAVHPWADVIQPEPAEDTGLMAPAGQLWSTADDLSRFGAFLTDGDDRVLTAATLAEMRGPASPPADDAAGYGLGMQLLRSEGRLLYGHTGSMPGFVATLLVSEQAGAAAVALANTTSGPDVVAVAADLIKILEAHQPRFPDRWRPQAGVDLALLSLTGLWYWGPRPVILRLLPDGGLELSSPGQQGPSYRFRAEPDGTWTGLDGYYAGEKLRVTREADGAATHIDLGTFIFTREPYDPASPPAGQPHPDGWQAGRP